MIYAVDVGGTPTVAFEAASLSRARKLSRELWFRVDIASVRAKIAPLWDGKADLAVRPAAASEMTMFWRAAGYADAPRDALADLVDIDR